jgi:hypothetical protein
METTSKRYFFRLHGEPFQWSMLAEGGFWVLLIFALVARFTRKRAWRNEKGELEFSIGIPSPQECGEIVLLLMAKKIEAISHGYIFYLPIVRYRYLKP